MMYSVGRMEASHSGLVRSLGKRVYRKVPEVRILPPPHQTVFAAGEKRIVAETKCFARWRATAQHSSSVS